MNIASTAAQHGAGFPKNKSFMPSLKSVGIVVDSPVTFILRAPVSHSVN